MQPTHAAADEAAIRAAGKAFMDAYQARDAKKLAALWSPEAIYTDPATGEETVGREAIQKVFEEAFADKQDVKLSVDVSSIDFVSPNVAIIRGMAHVTRPGEEPEDSEFTAVRVKRDGQWLMDRVTEIEKEKAPPSNYEHLKELEWMIGSWHDDDPRPAVEIQTDCQWTKNKNFMTRSFAVAIGERSQQIGHADYRLGSGRQADSFLGLRFRRRLWRRHLDSQRSKWLIQSTATLPDGGKATSLNIITRLNDNSFTWDSVNREIDGELQPNADPVVVVRKSDQ